MLATGQVLVVVLLVLLVLLGVLAGALPRRWIRAGAVVNTRRPTLPCDLPCDCPCAARAARHERHAPRGCPRRRGGSEATAGACRRQRAPGAARQSAYGAACITLARVNLVSSLTTNDRWRGLWHQCGSTPLHHAALLKHPEAVRMLLKAGANINAQKAVRAQWRAVNHHW